MAKGDIILRVEGKVTGAIKGESAGDAIDVHEWSWGMSGPSGLGGVGASGRVALSELRITKGADKASTALMSMMRSNEHIKKAVLVVRKAGVSPPLDYLTVTIERGRITAYSIASAGTDSAELVEQLSIAFEKIDIAYTAQTAAGAKAAASTFSASHV